jgi:hypothetical protein
MDEDRRDTELVERFFPAVVQRYGDRIRARSRIRKATALANSTPPLNASSLPFCIESFSVRLCKLCSVPAESAIRFRF